MGRFRVWGNRPVGVVSVVDEPVSRSFARKARMAFFVVSISGGALVATVLSAVLPWPVALLLGAVLGVLAGGLVAVVVRAWPVLRLLWWWSLEIAVLAVVAVGSAGLSSATSPWVSLLVLVAIPGALAAFGPVRRWVRAWVLCGVVRHRLRLCFGQFIRAASRTHAANLPLILLARPTPAGERVWVWLRPGLDLTDLDGKTAKLAVACWASEVRVVRASERYAALLRIDIARRDPLTGLVVSPLAALFPGWESTGPASSGRPPLALDLDDVPEPPAEGRSTARR